MKIFSLIFIGLILTFATNHSADAQSYTRSSVNQGVNNKSSVKVKSSQQAAQLVKNRLGGKILKVSKQNVNGQIGYKVKLLKKNGHVVSVLVDAYSGRIIGG